MGKEIIYDIDALLRLKQGVEKMVKAIKITYGPGAKNVVFCEQGLPVFSKDGASVAEHIDFKDPFENMGAQLIRKALKLTAEKVSDGTTTVAILSNQLLADGIRMVASGTHPIHLQKGIAMAHSIAQKKLLEISKPVDVKDGLKNIAVFSVNNDLHMGSLIAEAFKKNGKETVVQVKESGNFISTVEFFEGFEMDGGFLSPYFITDQLKNEVKFENALVFITNDQISSTAEILPLLTKTADASRPILIIAKDFKNHILSMLASNTQNGALQCVAVKPTLSGDSLNELLNDLALVTGTEVFSLEKDHDFRTVSIKKLGTAASIVISSNKTRITSQSVQKIPQRNEVIKSLTTKLKSSSSKEERKNIELRLARLTGNLTIISVGARTESELREKHSRMEAGINAVRAALEEGVVFGGGVSWLHLYKIIETVSSPDMDEQKGIIIFKKMLTAPFIALAESAGKDPLPLLSRVIPVSSTVGYDFHNDEMVKLEEKGILDPVKVVRIAMENAVSLVCELLKTKVALAEKNEVNGQTVIKPKI
jgi:chaperonin GroEL